MNINRKNEEQGRIISMYNQERLTRPQQPLQETTLPCRPTTAKVALLDPTTTADIQVPRQKQTITNTDTDKGEDELHTKGDPWNIGKAVEKYAEYVKEFMLKGIGVSIQETNALGNGQLAHNWGTLARELKRKNSIESVDY